MTDHREHRERMVMPGAEPTDDDLRQDVELTRQELARTVAALGERADVKARARAAAHRRAEAVQLRGEELVSRLPEPMARRVRPAWRTVSHQPAVPLGALAVLFAVLMVWSRLRRH